MANRLNDAQQFQLCKYIEGRRDEIARKRMRISQVAKAAQKDLGFIITNTNVRRAGICVGVRFLGGAPRSAKYPAGRGYTGRIISAAIISLDAKLSVIAAQLLAVIREMGSRPSAEFQEIADGARPLDRNVHRIYHGDRLVRPGDEAEEGDDCDQSDD